MTTTMTTAPEKATTGYSDVATPEHSAAGIPAYMTPLYNINIQGTVLTMCQRDHERTPFCVYHSKTGQRVAHGAKRLAVAKMANTRFRAALAKRDKRRELQNDLANAEEWLNDFENQGATALADNQREICNTLMDALSAF